MVMLSDLFRFRLVDGSGRAARLEDVGVALLAEDYPPVVSLHFRDGDGSARSINWGRVKLFARRERRIEVVSLGSDPGAPGVKAEHEVLLRRDVLDALVLDLQNRRATRANDLWLEEKDGRLLLAAADTSARAILRRISRGRFGRVRPSALYDWKYVEFLRGDPKLVRSEAGYHLRIARLPPGEIAGLTNPLPYLHAAELIKLLPDAKAADVLEAMSPERQLQVFEELDADQAVGLFALMAPNIAADLAGRLRTATMRSYLERLPPAQRERVVELLRYPEDTIGGIMTNDVVYAPAHLTIAEARTSLRERLKEPDFVFIVYVVSDDDERLLRGMISLRNLLTADDDQKLEDIMDPYLTTLNPLDAADLGAHRVINSQMAAMPVVAHNNRLLGAVTIDAAVARVAPPSWRAQAPRVFA